MRHEISPSDIKVNPSSYRDVGWNGLKVLAGTGAAALLLNSCAFAESPNDNQIEDSPSPTDISQTTGDNITKSTEPTELSASPSPSAESTWMEFDPGDGILKPTAPPSVESTQLDTQPNKSTHSPSEESTFLNPEPTQTTDAKSPSTGLSQKETTEASPEQTEQIDTEEQDQQYEHVTLLGEYLKSTERKEMIVDFIKNYGDQLKDYCLKNASVCRFAEDPEPQQTLTDIIVTPEKTDEEGRTYFMKFRTYLTREGKIDPKAPVDSIQTGWFDREWNPSVLAGVQTAGYNGPLDYPVTEIVDDDGSTISKEEKDLNDQERVMHFTPESVEDAKNNDQATLSTLEGTILWYLHPYDRPE